MINGAIKFGIVLLHYNTIDDTRNLVDNISRFEEFRNGNIELVIVDNNSPNRTGEIIQKEMMSFPNIHVLLLEENKGFARGNNIGYRYLMNNFDVDFIILSNTDILIEGDDFFKKIQSIYKKTQFAVLGPDIVKEDAQKRFIHQNPYFFGQKITKDFVLKEIRRISKSERKIRIKSRLKQIRMVSNLWRRFKSKSEPLEYPYISEEISNLVTLSGAFMIFSTEYMRIFPEGLSEKTFMYGEEHFLSYHCQREDLTIIYCPIIRVQHFEGRSTRSEKNRIQRSIFLEKEATKSLRALIMEIDYDRSEN